MPSTTRERNKLIIIDRMGRIMQARGDILETKIKGTMAKRRKECTVFSQIYHGSQVSQ